MRRSQQKKQDHGAGTTSRYPGGLLSRQKNLQCWHYLSVAHPWYGAPHIRLINDFPFAARSLIKSRPLDNGIAECLRQKDMIYHPIFRLTFPMRKSFGYAPSPLNFTRICLMLMQGCLPCRRGVETIQNIKPHLRLYQEGL